MRGTTPLASPITQFEDLAPAEFGRQVNQWWESAERIKNTVIEEVEQNNLPPVTGLGIVACVTGQTFGYSLFHGDVSPAQAALLFDGRN